MPSLNVPHGAAQFDFWHVSLKMNSSSSLAVSADTCWAGANFGANCCVSRLTLAQTRYMSKLPMQISIRADAILLSMMIRVNPMERLRAMLRWLAWSKLLEPVPRKLSHVNTRGAKSDPVPVPGSEQVPRDIDKAEPFLETELRAAVPLYMRKPSLGRLHRRKRS